MKSKPMKTLNKFYLRLAIDKNHPTLKLFSVIRIGYTSETKNQLERAKQFIKDAAENLA